MPDSNQELVARCQAGDRDAFDELAQAHGGRVFRVAYGLLANAEDAQDVAQDVLIALYRTLSRGRLRNPEALPLWLTRVCINQCRQLMRRRRENEPIAQWAFQADHGNQLEEQFLASETRAAMRQAVARLPRRQQAVFVLRHFAGLSIEEIARALGCAPATVRVHLSRATSRLRDVLTEGGEEGGTDDG